MEFTSREIQLLLYSIYEAISVTQCSFDFCARHGNMELAEHERKDLNDLKALYKRFLPDLSDTVLFGGEDK